VCYPQTKPVYEQQEVAKAEATAHVQADARVTCLVSDAEAAHRAELPRWVRAPHGHMKLPKVSPWTVEL